MANQYFYVRLFDERGENLATGIQVTVPGDQPLDDNARAVALGRITQELSRYALHEVFSTLGHRREAAKKT